MVTRISVFFFAKIWIFRFVSESGWGISILIWTKSLSIYLCCFFCSNSNLFLVEEFWSFDDFLILNQILQAFKWVKYIKTTLIISITISPTLALWLAADKNREMLSNYFCFITEMITVKSHSFSFNNFMLWLFEEKVSYKSETSVKIRGRAEIVSQSHHLTKNIHRNCFFTISKTLVTVI